ncbi:restriction endonuclease subunit S [Paractinoplanes brasiliensis]|uniref:Type I restriction enzyme S subunit n=1 Tax=Paractinoplanes brasiliensis TaxID=52695 RepID=A0A4V3C7Q7_9ACTN|nr:restriction endonuclease subunit S [Actinoplanes brasiliensis]TDO38588.1 type I restriction enzyme S subunit [Actinoplanes brasiliensis]GID26638.1 hypothetical protein Abr02nite_16210 [Actinoplanes brasiliensis]
MSEWRKTTLGDLVTLQRGHDLPSSQRIPGDVPVMGSGGVAGWHNAAKASGPGVTLGRAANLGVPALIQDDFWPLNTTLYVTDFHGNDVRFVYHLFQTLDLSGYNSGSVQPMLNRNFIKGVEVTVPEPAEQRKISATLAALDEKIGVNDRIAACALQLADAYFELAVDGIPAGPETFDSIAQVGGGGTPSTKNPAFWGGAIAWSTPSDVTALRVPYLFDTSRKITDAGLDECASALYPAGSILMTSRATIGAFAIPQIPTAVNQGFVVVTAPDENLTMWLFHEMRDRVDEMVGLANGSTFLELSRKNFKAMNVRLPAPEVVKAFAEKVAPLHKRASAASAENSTLIALRDTLLPELMSGRLRVKDAEKVVEDAV